MKLTETLLDGLMSDNGGWTRMVTSRLGVNWPLTSGWKRKLLRSGLEISEEEYIALRRLRNYKIVGKNRKKHIAALIAGQEEFL